MVFLAPFGIRPKGTVLARMIPLAAELTRRGHRVVIVAPPYTNPEDSGRDEVVDGVLLRNVALGPRHKVLAAPVLGWRMLRAALAEKPDLVHLFKPKGYAGIAAMLLLALRDMGMRLPPLVLDTDDWEGEGGMNDLHPYSGAEKKFYAFQERWLTRRAAAVSVASLALRDLVQSLRGDGQRILYLPNGVRQGREACGALMRERLGLKPDTPVLMLYTRFFEFDQQRLHRVVAEVARRVPAVRLLVVGKGRRGEEEQLRGAALAGGFAENVVFAGWVEPSELPEYLAAADAAIYPLDDTLLNRCKCPAKLTELLLAGVPVVADRVGQGAEYVADGVGGLLSDPRQWRTMADLAVTLLHDAEMRRRLGSQGRQRLLSEFSWHNLAGQLETLYAECGNR